MILCVCRAEEAKERSTKLNEEETQSNCNENHIDTHYTMKNDSVSSTKSGTYYLYIIKIT